MKTMIQISPGIVTLEQDDTEYVLNRFLFDTVHRNFFPDLEEETTIGDDLYILHEEVQEILRGVQDYNIQGYFDLSVPYLLSGDVSIVLRDS